MTDGSRPSITEPDRPADTLRNVAGNINEAGDVFARASVLPRLREGERQSRLEIRLKPSIGLKGSVVNAAGEPVEAHAPSLLYRTGKLFRRYRVGMTFAAALMIESLPFRERPSTPTLIRSVISTWDGSRWASRCASAFTRPTWSMTS